MKEPTHHDLELVKAVIIFLNYLITYHTYLIQSVALGSLSDFMKPLATSGIHSHFLRIIIIMSD